jgi:hypothetical protein
MPPHLFADSSCKAIAALLSLPVSLEMPKTHISRVLSSIVLAQPIAPADLHFNQT